MRITFTVGDQSDEDRIEYLDVGGFAIIFSDFGETSDGKPKYSAVTNGPSGLMMVKALQNGHGDYKCFDSSRCVIGIIPENEDEEKVFEAGRIEADEGVLLIDKQCARPIVRVWCNADVDVQSHDEIVAAYLPKIEMTLTSQMIREETYAATRKALEHHMQTLQNNAAAESQVAAAMGGGVHILGKGVAKRMRGRAGR